MIFAFLVAALKDLEISVADIGNDYLIAPCQEKFCKIAGLDFDSNKECDMMIMHALYGLGISRAAW